VRPAVRDFVRIGFVARELEYDVPTFFSIDMIGVRPMTILLRLHVFVDVVDVVDDTGCSGVEIATSSLSVSGNCSCSPPRIDRTIDGVLGLRDDCECSILPVLWNWVIIAGAAELKVENAATG
jgi:hypothetical protein